MLVSKIDYDNPEIRNYLGGEYSFWQTLKRGGIGSPKIIYNSGIAEFDKVGSQTEDLNYCNFEMFRDGFAIRIHKLDQKFIAAITFQEILKIKIINKAVRTNLYRNPVIRSEAIMNIELKDFHIGFFIPSVHYPQFMEFLNKNFSSVAILTLNV